jgi:hypothetical protein
MVKLVALVGHDDLVDDLAVGVGFRVDIDDGQPSGCEPSGLSIRVKASVLGRRLHGKLRGGVKRGIGSHDQYFAMRLRRRCHVEDHRLAIVPWPPEGKRIGAEQRFLSTRRRHDREGRGHGHRNQPLVGHHFHLRPHRSKMVHVGQRQARHPLRLGKRCQLRPHQLQRQRCKTIVAIAAYDTGRNLLPRGRSVCLGLAVADRLEVARHAEHAMAVAMVALGRTHRAGDGVGIGVIAASVLQCLDALGLQVAEPDRFSFHAIASLSTASTAVDALNSAVSCP